METLSVGSENGRLTQAQILRLVTAIDPNHVESKRGMSYMAQHEVRAELSRIFGYGNWDSQVESMDLIYERQIAKGEPDYPQKGDGKLYYVACYKAAVRLNIRDYQGNPVCSFVEYHAEENAPLPNRGEAHAMAVTSVQSYALRRAAIGLGDRLGLGLYAKGSMAPLVQRTLQLDDPQSPQKFQPQAALPQPSATVGAPVAASPDVARAREVAQQATADRDAKRDLLARAQQGMKVDSAPAS